MKKRIFITMFLVTGLYAHNIFHDWEKFLQTKYTPEVKEQAEYRNYEDTSDHVKHFYKINHTNQTLDFVLEQKRKYGSLNKINMSIWQVMNILDSMIDESDPDLQLPQSIHAYQTAEALRKDEHPRWLILTGFIHDLGKVLTVFDEPQWAVVGDTFPLGCAFSDKVVFSDFFKHNPDTSIPVYQTKYGIYEPHCGFDNLHMSWGHDEYLYYVVKDYLPKEALYIIRFHSFYAAHKEGAYKHLMNDHDKDMIKWLKLFNQYDLYSKDQAGIDIESIRPYYQELVAEFLPNKLNW